MSTSDLTFGDLERLAKKVGEHLDWSYRYLDVLATTMRAVFVACRIDERTGTVRIADTEVRRQLLLLETHLRDRDRKEGTIRTYRSAWQRITRIVSTYLDAVEADGEEYFWAEGINEFRRQRAQRRRRVEPSWRSGDWPSEPESLPPPGFTEAAVDTSDGPAVLMIPESLSPEDAIALIDEITRRVRSS